MTRIDSICRNCFHAYVCERFNEHKDDNNKKCHFANDHFVSADDVVEVVRCKDCIHFLNDTEYCRKSKKRYCEYDGIIHHNKHFCSYGERKVQE